MPRREDPNVARKRIKAKLERISKQVRHLMDSEWSFLDTIREVDQLKAIKLKLDEMAASRSFGEG